MAETINMPKLGFDMAEGTLVRWLRTEGETINKGDVLAEIETDKATVEVESSATGTVLKLLANQGDIVPVSAPIAVIGDRGEVVSDQPALPAPMPQAQVSEVEGSSVSRDQSTAPVESPALPTQPTPAPITQTAPVTEAGPIKASPLAKKIARDQKVELGRIVGSGPGGRIVRRDIEAVLASRQLSVISNQPVIPDYEPHPTQQVGESVKLTKLRQAIGRRLVESKQNLPHFYVTHEYKMEALMDLRKQINAYLPEAEKISVNDFIVKAAALALRQFPNLNASLNGDSVVRHGQVNIGVAVTVEGGLLTVVVRDADQKSLRQIAAAVKAMAARAREGKVKPEDVDGSTFSTSNLGMYDVEDFIAIINPPEAAILAIGSAREVPVVGVGQDGNPVIVLGWRMKATISVDHRVSDGAEAARFTQALALYLEEPLRLLV